MPPRGLAAVLRGQVLLDQVPHIGEGRELHDGAMKVGAIIRRLRLETKVAVWDVGRQPIDGIKIDHQENMICASACFLVYAAGAKRFGNYLALHRPHLPREEAKKINDAEYEALQKQLVPKVKAYLADMEIDQYWIDRMFAASSQDRYMPTWAEAGSKLHHLMGIVPSLEEIVLSKCNQDADVDRKLSALRNAPGSLSVDNQEKSKRLIEDSMVFFQCEKTVLDDMQSGVRARERRGFEGEVQKVSHFDRFGVFGAQGSICQRRERHTR
jgi:hypothetical protein